MKNKICWFEIYVKDLLRAKMFYSSVLGYQLIDVPAPVDAETMKMSFFSPPAEEGDFVTGALVEMPGTKEGADGCVNTIVYFPCEDCSVEESRVEAAGGFVHKTKFSIGQFGFISLCIDTEGNHFGLYSMT